jgi:hypothetical protein
VKVATTLIVLMNMIFSVVLKGLLNTIVFPYTNSFSCAIVDSHNLKTDKVSFDDAWHYLGRVKEEFLTNPEVYNEFLEIMRCFRERS